MGDRLKRNYLPTVGSDFSLKTIELSDTGITEQYQLLIWDLAGQEKFDAIRHVYFQGAYGALLVFDLTRRESFLDLDKWIEGIEASTQTKGVPLLLLGNKKDLVPGEINQEIKNNEIEDYLMKLNERYADQFKVKYYETSVISGLNVENSFYDLIREIRAWLPIRKKRARHLT